MIRKELFIECMDTFKEYSDYENKLADLDINIWEREEIQDLISSFLRLLAYCCKDEYTDKRYPNNIEYFIYDCEFGKKANEYTITEEDGTEIHLTNSEALWNYLVKNNPDIVDNSKLEDDIKTYSADLEYLHDLFS